MRRMMFALSALAAVGLVTISGCGGGATPAGGGVAKGGKAPAKTEAAVAGYAPSLKGKVTYNGDATPGPVMASPTKDQDKCPAKVPTDGWYVNEGNKGLQFAVVFLKPPDGGKKMPKESEAAKKAPDGKAVLELGQPHCQFEPRVIVLHPAQKLKVLNNSDPGIAHDSNIQGTGSWNYQKTIPAGTDSGVLDPDPSPNPYKVSCGIHTGTMGAFIWRPNHAWMTVTDKDGNYELKDVPVLEGGKKMELWVWHEMLPGDRTMKIGDVDVQLNEPATKDFALPKK